MKCAKVVYPNMDVNRYKGYTGATNTYLRKITNKLMKGITLVDK